MNRDNMEDISLKEMLEILNKHKITIAAIVGISVLIAVIYAFFLAVPMYNAQAEIEIMGLDTGVLPLDYAITSVSVNREIFEKVQDSQFMDRTSGILAENNIQIGKAALSGILSFSMGSKGNTIIIKAEYKEKKYTAQIVNAATAAFGEAAASYLSEQIQKQLTVTEERVKLARANYEEQLSAGGSQDNLHKEELDSALEVYKSFIEDYNRLKVAKTYYKDKTNIKVISNAVEPEQASKPDRRLIISAAFVLGLGIALFTAFSAEYLKIKV